MTTAQNSFAEKMRTTSTKKRAEIEAMIAVKVATRMEKEKHAKEVRDDLFTNLTAKYHDTIKRGIYNAARNGKRNKYINFVREDFKANFPGVGFPQQVQADWLNEMCNPDSIYLPVAQEANEWWEDGEKMHFKGVDFDVWNNKAFTVLFSW